jgi:hypothetical protein
VYKPNIGDIVAFSDSREAKIHHGVVCKVNKTNTVTIQPFWWGSSIYDYRKKIESITPVDLSKLDKDVVTDYEEKIKANFNLRGISY